jgi:glycerol-1-phosphate dehydrogenase [NAD(P)+]
MKIIVERGALQQIPDVRRDLNLSGSCLIVDDVNTKTAAGNSIRRLLEQDGCHVSEVIIDKPDMVNVEKVRSSIDRSGFVIGVGGTTVLDVTKLAAYQASARYVLFSTGLANNGISSKNASIFIEGNKETISVNLADAVIVDLDIVSKAPAWMIAAGCGDLAAEITAVKDWQLGRDECSEPYCDSVAELELSALNDVMENVDLIRSKTETGIRNLADALIRSGLGMSIWGSSRPASGSEHLWSHWIDHYAEENNVRFGQHGEQVGIGTLLMAKYHEFFNANWWSETEYPAYQARAIKSFLQKADAPTVPAKIGVEKDLVIRAFLDAWQYRKERYTILHKRHPTREDALHVISELAF